MKFGVSMFPTDESIGIVALARAAEEHGFESLWTPEHSHIPASRTRSYPGGGELPREYTRSLDPFAALAAAAAVTTRLRLGTGVCLVVERDPIMLAKEVTTVDFLSNGRFLFGVGGGWNLEEMQNHGTEPSRRWQVLRERVLAMQAIWTHEEAEFHGKYVNFPPIWQWPKPVQTPHPPIIIGGNGPRTLQRVIEYGDGWMPIVRIAGPSFTERLPELRRMTEAAGRAPIPITAWSPPPNERVIGEFQELGIDRVVFGLASAPADYVMPRLERHAELARRFQ